MKILYVALEHDYMNPSRGFSFEHYNFYDTLRRIPEYDVTYFPLDRIRELGRAGFNAVLKETVLREQPDVLFTILFQEELDPAVISWISKETKTTTIAWSCDDHWRFDTFTKHRASAFNWIVTTDPLAIKKYQAIGYKNVIQLPWACNTFLYHPVEPVKSFDLTFIGQAHASRKQYVSALQKAHLPIQCFGKGWDGGFLEQDDMVRLFSESRINLNFTASAGSKILRSIAKVFVTRGSDDHIFLDHPSRWKDNLRGVLGRRRRQIKGRNFEIPGCGGFLLTEYVEGLEDYYVIGKEIAVFHHVDELVDLVRYYLDHDEERKQIARAGYERTLRDHTYQKRFEQIFAEVSKI